MRDATDEVLPITTPERSGPALGLFDDVLYGGFVESAGVFFGIVKTLGQKGEEAVPGFELAAEGAQGEGEALAGGGWSISASSVAVRRTRWSTTRAGWVIRASMAG